ncbi:MAG TPA: hypothetical protein DDW65_01645 [Firmicutes bacterium]|jgi:hypothetical protein|nr:hypothetical protein [Bacillota bacterium]
MFGMKQKQNSGDGSLNIQAKQVNVGLTYSDVRQVAMDVFEGSFQRLSETASKIARSRAEELLDSYLKELEKNSPNSLKETQNPDMQYTILTAQKEYARSGNKDLGDLLVQLLVDRSHEDKQGLMQIVLNESLDVAPKLTPDQLDVLSLLFILKYTKKHHVLNFDSLCWYIENYLLPFLTNLNKKQSTYQHLEFASCGNITLGSLTIESIFLSNYHGLFIKGITKEELEPIPDRALDLIVPSLHDSNKFQVSAIDEKVLEKSLKDREIIDNDASRVKTIFSMGRMSEPEVKDFLLTLKPQLGTLFDVWENSPMKYMTLTSVGIAIGHANIQRKTGMKFDLTMWI